MGPASSGNSPGWAMQLAQVPCLRTWHTRSTHSAARSPRSAASVLAAPGSRSTSLMLNGEPPRLALPVPTPSRAAPTRVGARREHGVVLKHGADAWQVQLVHLRGGGTEATVGTQQPAGARHPSTRGHRRGSAVGPAARINAADRDAAGRSGPLRWPLAPRSSAEQRSNACLDGGAIGKTVGDGVRVAHADTGHEPGAAIHLQLLLHHRLALQATRWQT